MANPVEIEYSGVRINPMQQTGGSVALVDGNGVVYPADSTLPSEVVGSVAAGSTDSGKPVKVGGVYKSTAPAYTDGQRAEFYLNNRGGQVVQETLSGATGADAFANTGLGFSQNTSIASNLLKTHAPYKFNGTSWDRDRKPNAVSRIPSAAASVNATSAKASAGDVWKANGYNAKASVVYLKLYNKASAPTVGTDTPFATIAIPPSSAFNFDFNGLYMGTGIAYGFTTDAADNGTTALLAGDILGFSLIYA